MYSYFLYYYLKLPLVENILRTLYPFLHSPEKVSDKGVNYC
jgi:hypothetical protein